MTDFRIEEVKFMPEINKIIKDNFKLFPQEITFIELSNPEEDTKESFDLVYKSKVEISIRIRNNTYLKYADLTIRSKSKYGNKTELDKLIAGKGAIYLYAWKTIDNIRFESWILVDINKIRNVFSDYPIPDIYNNDGTAFKKYPISTIMAYDGLINYFNLPSFCIPDAVNLKLFDL
jgi:hypothetical protein